MNSSSFVSLLVLGLLGAGCGDDHASSGGGGSGGGSSGTKSGSGGSSGTGSSAGAFDACGGKIVDGSGKVDSAEYKKQATLWDEATIDCRLGPKFTDLHPGDDDTKRPTATEQPTMSQGGGYLCQQYDFGTLGSGHDYGSTSGQVAYAPKDKSDPGLDRLQTCGWENGIECHQPQQGGWTGGPHPDPGIGAWMPAASGLPVAIARTEMVETGGAIVVFTSGLVAATGTQTSGGGFPTIQLPAGKIPTGVAITTYNEFALVTVWDTAATKGQVAVIALRAPAPGAFSINLFAAPNEGGFVAMKLLGFVDLPDVATPTAIASAGNNGTSGGPWTGSGTHAYQGLGSIFADTSYGGLESNDALDLWTTDPAAGKGIFASSGGAVISSRWEGKATFLDLSPLFAFVRSVYVDPIASKSNQALFDSATGAGDWPFDFTTNPEMMPKVVSTVKVADPTVVRIGNRASGNATGVQQKLKAWVGGLDGTLTAFDVGALSTSSAVSAIATVQLDPNTTSLHLVGQFNFDDSLVAVSRGNRSVQWIGTSGDTVSVTRTLRDSRMDDPVDADPNDRRSVMTIGDFGGGLVLNFDIDTKDGCTTGDCDNILFDGSLSLPGSVYRVDTANVN